MPFFLKPCMRFRRKKKKQKRALKSCIKMCNDVTTAVTDDAILESHQSNSDTSIANQTDSSELNNSVSTIFVPEDDLTDTSVNETLDQNLPLPTINNDENDQFLITDDFSSESGVEDNQGEMSDARESMDGEDNQGKVRDVLSREDADDIIKEHYTHISEYSISQDGQNLVRDVISVVDSNKLKTSEIQENLPCISQNELNGNDSDKLLTAEKLSTETDRDIRCLKRIASIVNRVTVDSDVFEIIEHIKAIECEESKQKQKEEKHENLEENFLEMEEIRSLLNEIIDKLDICDLNSIITETNIAIEDYEVCENSLENENYNADLEVNIKNGVDQLSEVKLAGISSEKDSTKLEDAKEISISTVLDVSVSKKATLFENKNVQNITEITDLENKNEAVEKTKFLNFEENRFDQIAPRKISSELNIQEQMHTVNKGSEKMHYDGDGIQRTSKIESHPMCAEESTVNGNIPHSNSTTRKFFSEEFVCSKFIEMSFTTDEMKESDTDLNTDDEFLMKDETAIPSAVYSEEQNEAHSKNDFGCMKTEAIPCSLNKVSSINNNLIFSGNAVNCIGNENLLFMKPEMRQIGTTIENNELNNNFIPLSFNENEEESLSKIVSNDDYKDVKLNHNVNSSSGFELSVENETPFDLSVLPQCSFVQPILTTMNVKQSHDNTDKIKDYNPLKSTKDTKNMTHLEKDRLTCAIDIEEKYLSNHSDRFINTDEIVVQRVKPQNNENNERQKSKHISVHEKEEFNMTSNEKIIISNENKINDSQKCNDENISSMLMRDNDCTSKIKLQNGVHASDIERVSEWNEHKSVPGMERDMEENANLEKNESMISETEKSLSHSSNIYIKNSSFENFEEISKDESLLQYGTQAVSSIYRCKTKLDSQYDEMEILQKFDLKLDNTEMGRINVDVDNKDSSRNCCNKSTYKCRKTVSLPIHTKESSSFEKASCHNFNFGTHIDTFPVSNSNRKEIITTPDNFLEKLKFQISSNENNLVNAFPNDENESKLIYTDSSDESVNDVIYSEKSNPFFMQNSLISEHGKSTNQNVFSYTEKTKHKNTHSTYDESNVSDLDIIEYLDDSIFDRPSYCTTKHQDTDSNQEQNCCNFIDDEKHSNKGNYTKTVKNCSPDSNNKSLSILSVPNPMNNWENTVNNEILGVKYDRPPNFKGDFDNKNSELHENFEYFPFNSRCDHKSLNKYSVSSLSLSSESSKLSDSGDVKEVETNVKERESFISASGDNKDAVEKVAQNVDYLETHKELQNSRKTFKIKKRKSPECAKPCKVTINRRYGNALSKKNDFYLEENENYSVDNDLKTIEVKRQRSIEVFRKQKKNAMSGMRSNLRVIPIRRTEKFEFKFGDVDKKYKFHNTTKNEPNYLTHSDNLSNISETMTFSVQSKMAGHKMSIRTPTRKIKIQTIPKGDKTEQIYSELTESENELFCSQTSINMTPARKGILKTSRALRSPNYPMKVCRKSPLIFSKGKLVAYITKDENDESYHIRKGFRVRDADGNHHKYKLVDSNEVHTTSDEKRKNQASHTSANHAQTPDDPRLKFDDKFKIYAGKGRTNGDLITYKRSTEWLKDAGLVGNLLTTEEANDAFKVTAGVKVALNRGDYKHFLEKLSRLKKLNYNNIYERLCSAASSNRLNEV